MARGMRTCCFPGCMHACSFSKLGGLVGEGGGGGQGSS